MLVKFSLVFFVFLFVGCSENTNEQKLEYINVLSVSLDGSSYSSNISEIKVNTSLKISFSKALNPEVFKNSIIISPISGKIDSLVYLNNSTTVEIFLNLEYSTEYNIKINGLIGLNGETIMEPLEIIFTTQEDEIIKSKQPCINVNDCLQSKSFTNPTGTGNFNFFSNYPLYEDKAKWENLEKAIIVIHGASINPDDYFTYLTTSIESMGISDKTILLAPHFKDSPLENDDLYWSSLGYRDGKVSNGNVNISSFEILDLMIERLSNKFFFPVLNEIIITGQSSGGRFVHTYAAGNRSESLFADINFEYIVSESQYFYYPTAERIDQQTNNLYSTTNCSAINIWPYGFQASPSYVADIGKNLFDERFVNRNITYLLGNGSGADNTLNNTNCAANLSGSSRYIRGENIFRYMDLKFSNHKHKKVVAEGISHNGSAIYNSSAFKNLILQLYTN